MRDVTNSYSGRNGMPAEILLDEAHASKSDIRQVIGEIRRLAAENAQIVELLAPSPGRALDFLSGSLVVAGSRHFALGCQSPIAAPPGSMMIEKEPASITSVTSLQTVAPSDFALAVAVATSSTSTYGSQAVGTPGAGVFIMPPPVPSPTRIIV